jgi:hypothetical protein
MGPGIIEVSSVSICDVHVVADEPKDSRTCYAQRTDTEKTYTNLESASKRVEEGVSSDHAFCDLCIITAFCNTQRNEYRKRVTLARWPSVSVVVKTVIPQIISATFSSHVLPLILTTLTASRPERPIAAHLPR